MLFHPFALRRTCIYQPSESASSKGHFDSLIEIDPGYSHARDTDQTQRASRVLNPLIPRQEGNRVRRDLLPANRVPQTRFNELLIIYLGYYSDPNRAPLPTPKGEAGFIDCDSSPVDNNRWTGRLEQNGMQSIRCAAAFRTSHWAAGNGSAFFNR